MSNHGLYEPVTLALRVGYPPNRSTFVRRSRTPWHPGRASRRPDVLLLAIETDDDQELSVCRWRRLRFRRVIAEGLVLPNSATNEQMLQARAWTDARPSSGRFGRRANRLLVDRLSSWSEAVLRPAVTASKAPEGRPVGGRPWIMGWDLAWVFSRLARRWGAAELRMFGGWSLGLFDAPGAPGEASGAPRLLARQLRDGLVTMRWGGTPKGKKGRPHRLAPLVDLRHLVTALAGHGLDEFEPACVEFDVSPPTETGLVFDHVTSQLDAIDALHRAVLAEVDAWNAGGLDLDPVRLYSGGSVATGLFRTIGIPPCATRVLPDAVVGAAAGAFHGPRSESVLVGCWFPCVHVDESQSYVEKARLVGISDLLLAKDWRVDDATDELQQWLTGLAAASDPIALLLDPATWRRFGTVVAMVRADSTRHLYRKRTVGGEHASEFGPLRSSSDLPYFALDLAAGVIDGGPVCKVERAWRIRPDAGRTPAMHAVTLPGGVRFDPTDPHADLYETLGRSRHATVDDETIAPVARRRRAEGVKGMNVSAAYGNFARVDRQPIPARSPRNMECIDPWGNRFAAQVRDVMETPGPDHCPLIAGAVTAAGRLVLALIDRIVTDFGSAVAQHLVDACTIPAIDTGGTLTCGDTSINLLAYSQVRDIIDRLAPLGITLRAEHDSLEQATKAFIAGPNRYLLARIGALIHTSEFALGGVYCDPTGQHDARTETGMRAWVAAATQSIIDTDLYQELTLAGFGERWAVSPFRASSPQLARMLGLDTRPFAEALALHATATHDCDGAFAGPVVVGRHDTSPEQWPTLAWHPRGDPTHLFGAADWSLAARSVIDMPRPVVMDDVISDWRVKRGRGMRRGYAGLIPPRAASALDHIELIGKEGDQLLDRQRGITTAENAVTVYNTTATGDPTWTHAANVLRSLGPDAVAQRFPDIPYGTRWYWSRGRAPREPVRTRVIDELCREATRELARAHSPIPESADALLAAYATHVTSCNDASINEEDH
jgi:hypothetical protein